MWKTPLDRLRLISLLEGTSFLLLLGVAMPLKYSGVTEGPVKVVGMAHGVLWVLMLASIAEVWWRVRWPWTRAAVAVLASVLPGGPFVLERSVRSEEDGTNHRDAEPAEGSLTEK